MKRIINLLVLFICVSANVVLSQAEVDTSKEESKSVIIKNSDFYEFRGDLDPPEQFFKGNVKMTHDSVFMFSDTATVSESFLTAMGEVVILQNDTIKLFSDSLYYNSETNQAKLFYDVVLENGEQQLFTDRLNYNTETKIAVYPDTAILRNKRTTLNSLRGKYDMNAKLATFVGEVIVVDKEFELSSDSLLYNTSLDKAIFVSPTTIKQEARTIYCERGFYDIKNGRSEFSQNANYIEGEKTAKANTILYDERTKIIDLIGNAMYRDEEKLATADKMSYNENTKEIILTGNAIFDDGETQAKGEKIIYNENTEEISIEGNTNLDSEDSAISSKNLSYDDSLGVAIFTDDVEYYNKQDSVFVYSDRIEVDDKNSSFIANGETRPYMLQFIDSDSMLLSADQLIVSERIDSLDTINVFKAYHDVRIWGEEFQAISDSLYYDSVDSIFVLYDQPMMWSDSMQFSADTIKLKLGDSGIDKIYLLGNGMINEWLEDKYYNQLKAKYIEAQIDSSKIKDLLMTQNAEANYYILDDVKDFIGLNFTLCNRMRFFFEEGELSDIKFYETPTSKLTPFQDLKDEQIFLKDFKWEEDKKPKSLEDLLKPKEKVEIRVPEINLEEIDGNQIPGEEVDQLMEEKSTSEKQKRKEKKSNGKSKEKN